MDEAEDPPSPSINLAVDEVPGAENFESPLNLEIRESARSVAISSTAENPIENPIDVDVRNTEEHDEPEPKAKKQKKSTSEVWKHYTKVKETIEDNGTNLLLFSFPIMLVAAMGCLYLHLKEKSSTSASGGGGSRFSKLRRPVAVIAPLGIMSAVELTFAAMFVALMIWSLVNYVYVSWRYTIHHHMDPHEKLWHAKFRSVSLRVGYIGNTCWAFLFFPVTRASSILPLVGLTSESSIKYHIWLGHLSNVLFAAHRVGFTIYWVAMSHEAYLLLEWSSTYVSNVAGVIAFVVSLVMWATSIERVRRKMFELLFYSHHLYIPYIIFYMLHVGPKYLCMILPGIFLFLVDRYLRFLQSRRRTRLLSARLLPNGTMEMSFAKNPGLSYNPTSIIFINVPSISKLQWHPFSISSSSSLDTDRISILIKSEGSWTQKLYKQLSSSDHLEVSTEGPYGPTSSHFLSRESLVMISGGSGITPFISIIREIISRSTESNITPPKLVLIAAFKKAAGLTMLDLLLPLSSTPLDMSKIELQIEAYVTQEHENPIEENSVTQIETKIFKSIPSDSPISSFLGKNSWLWLGAIIASSFVMFLLLLAFVTRYHIYPVEKRGENYHYSFKILWDMFLVCCSIFISTSAVFLWQKREFTAQGKQFQIVDLPTPKMSPSSWLSFPERELESHPYQSIVQSANVHFGSRPDLTRILLDRKERDVGVMVCGPKSLRHQVARICASGLAKNLNFECISFSW